MCAFVLCCFTGGTVWFWYAFSLQKNNVHSRLSIHHPYKNLQAVSAFTSTTSDRVVSDGFATSTHVVQEVVNLQKKDEVMLKKPAPSSTVVLEDIPETITLSVPFTSQAPEKNWDQPWQDACEEAAVLMVDAYYKGYGLSPLFSKDEIQKMVDWEDQRGWGTSISAKHLQGLYHHVSGGSHNLRILEKPTIREIKEQLSLGNPVIGLVYGKSLNNPYFSSGGPEYHALVIIGFNETGFLTHDPGTSRGKEFVYSFNTIMSSLHDWNGGDVLSGVPVVLFVGS